METVLAFACHPLTVGHLAGRNWAFVTGLCKEYEERFDGRTISISYDGLAFRVRMLPYPEGMMFIHAELGQRIAVANQGIMVEPVGAIIGKGGWWLRKTEKEQVVPCMIYHEDRRFFVKFPWHVSTKARLDVLDDVRRKLVGRSVFMQRALSDTDSCSSVSTSSSLDSLCFSDNDPTPDEAYH